MKLFVRRMEEEDYPALLPLQEEIQRLHEASRPDLFRRGAVSYPEEAFRMVVNDLDWRCAVCEADGRIVGFVFSFIRRIRDHRNMTDADLLVVDDICVAEDFRRRGAGRALFDYAEAASKEAGCARLELSVWAFNKDALAFYRAMGLVPREIRMEKREEAEEDED